MIEVALKIKRGICLLQFENQVDTFNHHQSLCLWVRQVEQAPVGGDTALTKATIDSSPRKMIQISQSYRHVDRVVLWQNRHPTSQADLFGAG